MRNWFVFLLGILLTIKFVTTACNFWTVCKIGVIYSSQGKYAPYSLSGLVVADMYTNGVNEKCGIGGLGIQAQIVKYDIFSDVTFIPNATIHLIEQDAISVLLLPEGPSAEIAAAIANSYNIPLIAGMSGVQSLFVDAVTGNRRFSNVFGPLTPATEYMGTFLQLMHLNQYTTIGVISMQNSPDSDVCNAVSALALYNEMQVIQLEIISNSLSKPALVVATNNALSALQAPDVLISCMSLQCDVLFDALQNLDLNFKAHGTFECLNEWKLFPSTVTPSAFAIGPVQWDERIFGQDYKDIPSRPYGNLFPYRENDPTSIPSPLQFFQQYQIAANLSVGQPPMTSLTAGQMAAFYMIDYAVYKANSTNPVDLLDWIKTINMKSFFGLISVDEMGQNSNREIVQRQAAGASTIVVFPPLNSPVLPMPTWHERVFQEDSLNLRIQASMTNLSYVFSFLSFLLMIFLTVHRNHESVKSVSLLFALLMIVGCIILYWAHMTWQIYNDAEQCKARIAVWIFGYTMLLSPMIVTSYRIHKIINNRKLSEITKITDRKLLLLLFGLFLLPTTILVTLWSASSSAELQPVVIVTDINRPSTNFTDCVIQSRLFPYLLLAQMIFLLGTALYYGFNLRRIGVQYQQFNNARLILLLTFVIVLLTTVGAVIQYATPDSIRSTKYLIRTLFAMLIALVTQVLFFYDIVVDILTRKSRVSVIRGSQFRMPSHQKPHNPITPVRHIITPTSQVDQQPTQSDQKPPRLIIPNTPTPPTPKAGSNVSTLSKYMSPQMLRVRGEMDMLKPPSPLSADKYTVKK